MSAIERRAQSTDFRCWSPALAGWEWASMNPGTTVLPPRSKRRARDVARFRTSSFEPTARKRPSAIATAWACGWAASIVTMRPFVRTRSASVRTRGRRLKAPIPWRKRRREPSVIGTSGRMRGRYYQSCDGPLAAAWGTVIHGTRLPHLARELQRRPRDDPPEPARAVRPRAAAPQGRRLARRGVHVPERALLPGQAHVRAGLRRASARNPGDPRDHFGRRPRAAGEDDHARDAPALRGRAHRRG